jgi:hypothetical protein
MFPLLGLSISSNCDQGLTRLAMNFRPFRSKNERAHRSLVQLLRAPLVQFSPPRRVAKSSVVISRHFR